MANKPLGEWLRLHKPEVYQDVVTYWHGNPYAHNLVENYIKEYYPEVYTQWLLTR